MKKVFFISAFLLLNSLCFAQVQITEKEYAEYKRIKSKLEYSYRDSVRIKLSDRAYACGDCYPNYRIEAVVFSEEPDKSYYFNKEIYVKFIDENLSKELEILKCRTTCYTYVLHGIMKQNGYGSLLLEAVGGVIMSDADCCQGK